MTPPASATATSVDELAINSIRFLAIDAVQKANSGHPGAPMGLAPVGYVLFNQVMRHNPANSRWFNRDRFVLSAGHASMLQYALLHLSGYDLPMEQLKQFRQWGSATPGHPEYKDTDGVDTTTGPLGQGFGNAVGIALAGHMLAEEFNRENHEIFDFQTWCVASDGDIQEGVASEAASLAGHLGLGRLCVIYDDNHIQLAAETKLAFSEDVGKRFEAYGWHVQQLSDPDAVTLEDLKLALEEARGVSDRPSLVQLRTHIGYGSPNKQDSSSSHGSPLGPDEVKATKEALGWPADEDFYVPDEAREVWDDVKRRGQELEAEWSQLYEEWASENKELADDLERRMEIGGKGKPAPKLVDAKVPTWTSDDKPQATRSAGGEVLNWAADLVPELAGGSADLDPSTKTPLKEYGDVQRHSYRGRNIHYGVREHAMGAITNGLTLTGYRGYGATFFCFLDYMRPSVRLSSVMQIPSLWIYTHDSIGLGEDGTTHQPIEHLAILRATPKITSIRPADGNETAQAVKWALMATDAPTALVLSRQNLPNLDDVPEDAVERGAYVLRDADGGEPDVILISTGSEVSICVEALEVLSADGVKARLVSMPSTQRFAAQDQAYRDSVLPPSVTARLSVEAGSSLGWDRWIGPAGASIAMEEFGRSAPADVLYEQFGFTKDAIAAKAKELANGNG